MTFDFLTLLGAAMIALGVVSIIRSRKSRAWKRARLIVAGVFLMLAGVAMITPLIHNDRQREMLDLQPDSISEIVIYEENEQGQLLAQIVNREFLSNWASILKKCNSHQVVHPLYESGYLAEVDYKAESFKYKLNLDSRNPGTVDLQPFDESTILSMTVQFIRGTYRCDGLYDFLFDALQP